MTRKLRVVQGGGKLAKERARVAQIEKSIEAHFRQWHAETVELHARLRRSKDSKRASTARPRGTERGAAPRRRLRLTRCHVAAHLALS